MANILDWIEAKRLGRELDHAALIALVRGYTSGDIPDYQMSAWLMAVTINGMSLEETCALTEAMLRSGETLALSELPGPTLDKHSSGGVGDKVTLALVPMLAEGGLYVAKMSGHGLGLTGGTLDKLESVPGLRTNLTQYEIMSQVREIGACLCAQSDSLAPADRAIYALRDVTGTVASIPLIASSIISKKLACGADALLLDIKVGSGAFMQDVASARELAHACVAIAEGYGKRVTAVLSDMNQPLGRAVGNAIELREAAALLKPEASNGDARLRSLTCSLYANGLQLGGIDSLSGAESVLSSGAALSRLREIVEAQRGNLSCFDAITATDDIEADVRERWAGGAVVAEQSGFVSNVDARLVARTAAALGASRNLKGNSIDYDAGIWLGKSVGDYTEKGETLAWMNSSNPDLINDQTRAMLLSAYGFSDDPPKGTNVILETIFGNANRGRGANFCQETGRQ